MTESKPTSIADDFAKLRKHLREAGMLRNIHDAYRTSRQRMLLTLNTPIDFDNPGLALFQLGVLKTLVGTNHVLHAESLHDLQMSILSGILTVESMWEAVERLIRNDRAAEGDCLYIPGYVDPGDETQERLNEYVWNRQPQDKDDQT